MNVKSFTATPNGGVTFSPRKAYEKQLETYQRTREEAAEFASSIGPERVVSISEPGLEPWYVVNVWYWE